MFIMIVSKRCCLRNYVVYCCVIVFIHCALWQKARFTFNKDKQTPSSRTLFANILHKLKVGVLLQNGPLIFENIYHHYAHDMNLCSNFLLF